MPTYQYACTECGHRHEVVQSFTDEPLTECPQCQGRLRKVFNSVGIVFKGSGFYRNDSREKPAAASEKSGDKTDVKGEPKVDAKSENKTDKKSTGPSEGKTGGDSSTPASTKKSDSGSSTTGSAA